MALEVAPAASMAMRMFCQYCNVLYCVIRAAAVSGVNGGSAAAPAQRFDPFVQHNLVPDKTAWQSAPKVDLPLVDQAPQPKRQGFLVPGKGTLLGGNPGDFSFRDHTAGEGLQKDFTDSHGRYVTTSLHLVVPRLGPRPEGAMAWTGHPDQSASRRQPGPPQAADNKGINFRVNPQSHAAFSAERSLVLLSGLLIDGPGLVH